VLLEVGGVVMRGRYEGAAASDCCGGRGAAAGWMRHEVRGTPALRRAQWRTERGKSD
jgi:hypothetical protein